MPKFGQEGLKGVNKDDHKLRNTLADLAQIDRVPPKSMEASGSGSFYSLLETLTLPLLCVAMGKRTCYHTHTHTCIL